MKTVKKRIENSDLKSIYQGSYVENLLAQTPYRVVRLLSYFELSENDVVADFGCGTGLLAELIVNRVRQYVGVDWSEEFVRVARERMQTWETDCVRFECADIVEFCGAHENEFDVAFTLDFSEHIYDSDFIPIYRGIYKALKPGGSLYLHTPNGEYVLERMKQSGILNQTLGHVAVRKADDYRTLLERIGYTDFRVWFLPHYLSVLRAFHFLSYLPLVGRFFQVRILLSVWK